MLKEPQLLQLTELFNYVEDVLAWVKDRDGRYCWVSRANLVAYSASLGDDPRNILGKTDHDLSPAFLADQYLLDEKYVLEGNRLVNRIELVPQPDGTTAWHVTTKIPVFASDGTIIGTAGVSRRLNATKQGAFPGTEFEPVLAYLRDHYGLPITNIMLARLAHMSVRAFERKFQSCYHLTPQGYLRKLRMRMASQALVYTNRSLAQVATSCGCADQSHFSREFRQHFGKTPRQYRDHYTREAANAATGTRRANGDN
jgi:AraC-like DNA-binding protein